MWQGEFRVERHGTTAAEDDGGSPAPAKKTCATMPSPWEVTFFDVFNRKALIGIRFWSNLTTDKIFGEREIKSKPRNDKQSTQYI
jgi:hypothetical protein